MKNQLINVILVFIVALIFMGAGIINLLALEYNFNYLNLWAGIICINISSLLSYTAGGMSA